MSKQTIIEHAFITAAGFGARMRPLTDDRCKPMVEVGGKPIIGHVLDRLVAAGVKHVGVNTFYKPESLETYLQQYETTHPGLTITVIRENELMDTGGGIKGGLSMMPDAPFYVVSGDSYWEDSDAGDALKLMAAQFDPVTMDMMLMLKTLADMHPTQGSADYNIDNAGKLSRTLDKTGPYAWMSVRILKDHSLFDNTPDTPFSFLTLLDKAQAAGRLYGYKHEGAWHHFSTPADIAAVNNLLAAQKKTVVEEPHAKRGPTI